MLVVFSILFIIIVSVLIYMWREAHENNVKEISFSFSTFPKSLEKMTIFFISDIHRRVISEKLINEVKGKADIVVIGGDLTEKGVPFDQVKKNLLLLKGLGPTYFVWGNNDYEVEYHMLDALMLDVGVKILDNTAVSFESREGEKISLLGIDDLRSGRGRLDLALEDAGKNDVFKILVSHHPDVKKYIQPEHKISLVLSGHTHGGQIRLFNLGLYKKGGVEQFNNTTLLVSNGYGTSSLPLRLGAPPETHLITIRSTH